MLDVGGSNRRQAHQCLEGDCTKLAQLNEGPFDKKEGPSLVGGKIEEVLESLAGCQSLREGRVGYTIMRAATNRQYHKIRHSNAKIKSSLLDSEIKNVNFVFGWLVPPPDVSL